MQAVRPQFDQPNRRCRPHAVIAGVELSALKETLNVRRSRHAAVYLGVTLGYSKTLANVLVQWLNSEPTECIVGVGDRAT
jgi:hypothetical protein